ncbi:MAG: hypothetical protein P4L33_08885 [Capsulimonadaceae bacterium]|nr:hypothetical protein [Capsulimonadaceae bacterium]
MRISFTNVTTLAISVLLMGISISFAKAADGYQSIAPIDFDHSGWAPSAQPAYGPALSGATQIALAWQVDAAPVLDSPAIASNLHDLAAIRFWLWIDRPRAWSLTVLLLGSPGGYYYEKVPLDFTGWKQIVLKPSTFSEMRKPDPITCTGIGFRAQGYGQPPIGPNTIFWLAGFEALPRPGTTLIPPGSPANLDAWQGLAKSGNPLIELINEKFKQPIPDFVPPETVTSGWKMRGVSQDIAPIAYAAGDPASPYRGRADLVQHVINGIDWLVKNERPDGTWWSPGRYKEGDPNVNRFTLGPLLDSVLWLQQVPGQSAIGKRWATALKQAVTFQKDAYAGKIDWDWGGRANGLYVNQDVFYMQILAQSDLLWATPGDKAAAHEMMVKTSKNLLPEGGLHYISDEMEAPVYHSLDLHIIARYYTLTRDPLALETLKNTVSYWPLTLTAEGYPEYWSDVWWKQTWGDVNPTGLVIAAGATGDARNRWLMWQVLKRKPATIATLDSLYASPYWPGTDMGTPVDDNYLRADNNIRGYRGRAGKWYYGVTQGRGLRSSFAGGLISAPDWPGALVSAFRGAHIDIVTASGQEHGLWLSQRGDNASIAVHPNATAALGVQFSPQASLVNGIPPPPTPDNDWRVSEMWTASADGVAGVITARAIADTKADSIVGRIKLGPAPVIALGDNLWRCGGLMIKLYQPFGDVTVATMAGYTPTPQWPGLQIRQSAGSTIKAGTQYSYGVWVGPVNQTPPSALTAGASGCAVAEIWANGRTRCAYYNPSQNPVRRTALAATGASSAWSSSSENVAHATLAASTDELVLRPGECLLVESGASK